MSATMNPGNRPRRGALTAIGAMVVVALVAMLAVLGTSSKPAAAAGLERFASCEELSSWGEAQSQSGEEGFREVGSAIATQDAAGEVATSVGPTQNGVPADGAPSAESGQATDEKSSTGSTNVVVEGVDELDLVDRVDDRRAIFTSYSAVVLVDLEAGKRLASVSTAGQAQVTYDSQRSLVWVVGQQEAETQGVVGSEVVVKRLKVNDDSLVEAGQWSVAGGLVTARRVDDKLHVVATDGFYGAEAIPFRGEPVPCDQVLHPAAPSDPSATLIVTLGAEGDLVPVHSTEVVGSGQLVHVTTTAAYLATPQWEAETSTTIHRFDLDDLTHTGSGRVPGTLLNDFSMSEFDGHLRVAITAQPDMGIPAVSEEVGRPIADPDMSVEPTFAPVEPSTSEEPITAEEPPISVAPTTTAASEVPATTAVPTTTEAPTTTTEAPTTTAVPTTTAAPTTTEALSQSDKPGPNDGLNRIYVLDTDGDLDVVGRTGWFGLEGETLHGIRFDGATAYAVTFLQTDPFYVVDLSEASNPRVVGELKLPGFSGYLHPVGNGQVVGFGPDESGMASAKLFDASDPTAPRLVDTISLGGDAPVVYDHHAFTTLGDGHFVTPVNSWEAVRGIAEDCVLEPSIVPGEPGNCAAPSLTTDIVEMAVSNGRLQEVSRTAVQLNGSGLRVLPVGEGWALLSEQSVALVEPDGALRAEVNLS